MTTWLIDKSALVRLAGSADAEQWAERIQRGLLRITLLTRLEVGFSARSGRDVRDGSAQPPLASRPIEYLTPAIEQRAEDVQAQPLTAASIVRRRSPTCSSRPPLSSPTSLSCTSTRTPTSSPRSPASQSSGWPPADAADLGTAPSAPRREALPFDRFPTQDRLPIQVGGDQGGVRTHRRDAESDDWRESIRYAGAFLAGFKSPRLAGATAVTWTAGSPSARRPAASLHRRATHTPRGLPA